MPIIAACRKLFADADQPWTIEEIAARLECIEPGMKPSRVYRAWRHLCELDDAEVAVAITPLRGRQQPFRFGPQGTRLIARQALSRRTKKKIVELARSGTTAPLPLAPAKK